MYEQNYSTEMYSLVRKYIMMLLQFSYTQPFLNV